MVRQNGLEALANEGIEKRGSSISKLLGILVQFYHCCSSISDGKGNFVNQVLDIEDLVTLGQKFK